jgi:hypothetical protein
MKPSPLSAVLADDRVGARLDTDDDLGALLLAVAHQADTPIPRPVPTRRRRSHRGLTVLAALGVAVSGATVAAAVDLAPMHSEQAGGMPHTRAFLPPSLQALVMPFLAGTPFQGRLVLPFGSLPGVTYVGTSTAAGLPNTPILIDGLVVPASSATPSTDSELGNQEQQNLSRQNTEARASQTGGTDSQGNQGGSGTTAQTGNQGDQSAQQGKPTKPTPTPTPTPASTGSTGNAYGATNGQANGASNGQANGATNGNGSTNGNANGHGRPPSGPPTSPPTGTPSGGTGASTGDDPVSGGPDKPGAVMRSTTGTTTSGTSKMKTSGGAAATSTSTAAAASGR